MFAIIETELDFDNNCIISQGCMGTFVTIEEAKEHLKTEVLAYGLENYSPKQDPNDADFSEDEWELTIFSGDDYSTVFRIVKLT